MSVRLASWRPLLVLVALASSAGAQSGRASVSGHVRDTNRVPVPLVEVTVAGYTMATDSAGRFAFASLPPGPTRIMARRLGFVAHDAPIELTGNRADTLTIVLASMPGELPEVTTSAAAIGRMAEFERHRRGGMGIYLDRKQLEARRTSVLSDVMRRLPGIRIQNDRTGRTQVRMGRSLEGRECPPEFWIDGVKALNFNVDDIPLRDIEAIEIYKGPSGLPPEFNSRGNTICGSVVIWTRVPG